jgi:hypothetical protein
MKTFEEIREFLAGKIKLEKKRLKTYSAKAGSYDISNVITRYVQSLMADARYSEIQMFEDFSKKKHLKSDRLDKYVKDRKKGLKHMREAFLHEDEASEKRRPWHYSKNHNK